MVNYFDLGPGRTGTEMEIMTKVIFPRLNILNYRAFSLDANMPNVDICRNKFKDNPRIQIQNVAICDSNHKQKLYLAHDLENHSIYKSHPSVSENYREVQGRRFGEWLNVMAHTFTKDFNILRMNIGGAEVDLIENLKKLDLLKYMHVICGETDGVTKVDELFERIPAYRKTLAEEDITIYPFSTVSIDPPVDMFKVIQPIFEEYQENSKVSRI